MAGTYRLVASDVDGTLLLNWNETPIEPLVFEQIRELRRRGVIFLISSGRQINTLRRLFAPVADDIAYLCNNGSLAVLDGEVLFKRPMNREHALEFCHAVMETPGVDIFMSGERTTYALASRPGFIRHLEVVMGDEVCVINEPEDIKEDFIKISYYGAPEVMSAVRGGLAERFAGKLKLSASGASWEDIMGLGVDKGSSMRMLSELWGIAPEEMVAFGDNDNDREMLNLVGLPCLMESGSVPMRTLNERIRVVESVHAELAALLAEPGVF